MARGLRRRRLLHCLEPAFEGSEADRIERFAATKHRLLALTAADVQAAARRYLLTLQHLGYVRTNEAGGTGDQNPHDAPKEVEPAIGNSTRWPRPGYRPRLHDHDRWQRRNDRLEVAATGPIMPSAPCNWTYGNGRTLSRTLDQDYRPLTIEDPNTGGLSAKALMHAVEARVRARAGVR